jgi:hypothetical protein
MFSGASAVNTGVHIDYPERTPGCGCIGHPAFPAPSVRSKGRDFPENLGRSAPRERERMGRHGKACEAQGNPAFDGRIRATVQAEGICKDLVLPDRIELSTSPLPRECSTTELRQHARRPNRQESAETTTCGRPVLATSPPLAQAGRSPNPRDRPPGSPGVPAIAWPARAGNMLAMWRGRCDLRLEDGGRDGQRTAAGRGACKGRAAGAAETCAARKSQAAESPVARAR